MIENLQLKKVALLKSISLLVWLTQLGLSVAIPLAGFVFLGVWLHQSYGWGKWVIIVGGVLGVLFAVEGLRSSLQAMKRLAGNKDQETPVSFNEHD